MPKISSSDGRNVTFSITLPVAGLFEDHIAALERAKVEQLKMRNFDAAHALHTIEVLAKGGLHTFNTLTSAGQIVFPSDGHGEAPPLR